MKQKQNIQPVVVMKFGGSSVGTGKRMLHVADIVAEYACEKQVVVIVSAIKGVTDKLELLFNYYRVGDDHNAKQLLHLLYHIHTTALQELTLPEEDIVRVEKSLINLFGQLSFYLLLQKDYSPAARDYVVSFGERFSSYLVAAALNRTGIAAKPVDSAQVIVTDDVFGNAKAKLSETKHKAQSSLVPLLQKRLLPVVSGFFGATETGKVITLGRGGSDYSATILAHALDAQEVILWKEVDGVFTSDPQKNVDAVFYPELSYQQAEDLAHKGAKVLHPEAMAPFASKGITLWVRNTFKPEGMGTKIWKGAA